MSYQTRFMQRALELAAQGAWTTPPNPQVGCVICDGQTIIAEGWHEKPGQPHAEAMALTQAGPRARGATVYVNLEPCSHHGRTGPCCDALIAAGVDRVYVACGDPNPQVNGGGIKKLNEAGIKTETGLLQAQARRLNEGFFKRFEQGLPKLRLKLAASLDGRTATRTGHSKWITGPEARADVQQLRAEAGAILTGIGTLLADDPELNVRLPQASRQPIRVIVDSSLRTPLTARMLAPPGDVLIATRNGTQLAAPKWHELDNVEIVDVAAKDGRVDMLALLQSLASRGINDVHVECGAELAGDLISRRLVDELIIYLAPKFVGPSGLSLLNLDAIDIIDDAISGDIKQVRQIGKDIRIDLKLSTEGGHV